MYLKKNDRYKATLTLFGFFRLVNVPLKLVLLPLPAKLSPTAGHGFNFLNDSGMATFVTFNVLFLFTAFPSDVTCATYSFTYFPLFYELLFHHNQRENK